MDFEKKISNVIEKVISYLTNGNFLSYNSKHKHLVCLDFFNQKIIEFKLFYQNFLVRKVGTILKDTIYANVKKINLFFFFCQFAILKKFLFFYSLKLKRLGNIFFKEKYTFILLCSKKIYTKGDFIRENLIEKSELFVKRYKKYKELLFKNILIYFEWTKKRKPLFLGLNYLELNKKVFL